MSLDSDVDRPCILYTYKLIIWINCWMTYRWRSARCEFANFDDRFIIVYLPCDWNIYTNKHAYAYSCMLTVQSHIEIAFHASYTNIVIMFVMYDCIKYECAVFSWFHLVLLSSRFECLLFSYFVFSPSLYTCHFAGFRLTWMFYSSVLFHFQCVDAKIDGIPFKSQPQIPNLLNWCAG